MNPRWVPMGDQGWIGYFSDEPSAIHFARTLRQQKPAWLVDVVPAYASVGVFHDPQKISHHELVEQFEAIPSDRSKQNQDGKLHIIPCCYEMQLDLSRVATLTKLDASEIIRIHSEPIYTVYAVGFCPGFPYLGYLPDSLSGVPRLDSPRVRVEPGSVGLTGRQTGLYPLVRPGGWNIIGRTPLIVVDMETGFFPIQVGDRVQFQPISRSEFHQLEGKRL